MADQPKKKPYDEAYEAFIDADTEYQMLERCILEGEFIPQTAIDGTVLRSQFKDLVQQLRDALEERNVRLKNLKDQLRMAVILGPKEGKLQQRGPDGKGSKLDVGSFSASSVTKRWFDHQSLFAGVAKHGLLERLHELTTLDKEGKTKKLVEQVWKIDYENVMTWLKANKLEDVIDGAYDEKEDTPQVKGPKPLTFLGDEQKT